MDCLQCVRSRQWVGAVPLGLVMGGDPPPRPEGEAEEENLIARLMSPHRMFSQRTITGKMWIYCRFTKAPTIFINTVLTGKKVHFHNVLVNSRDTLLSVTERLKQEFKDIHLSINFPRFIQVQVAKAAKLSKVV